MYQPCTRKDSESSMLLKVLRPPYPYSPSD